MVIQAFLIRLSQYTGTYIVPKLERRASMEVGQGLVEYAMLMILVGLAVMALLVLLGPAIGNMFENIINNIRSSTG